MALTERNIDILRIIVEEYIETWDVLWSKLLLKKYDLWVSPATVRNDMAKLEELELIYQPYNSAWRLPTTKWLRAFINYLMQHIPDHFLEEKSQTKNEINNLLDFIYKITFELAKNTNEIAFFIIPDENIQEVCWIWNFLKINLKRMWDDVFNLIKVLEDKPNYIRFMQSLPHSHWVSVFIWEENITPFLKDYTIIVKSVIINWKVWYVWIIWWLKMNYWFNISAVRGII